MTEVLYTFTVVVYISLPVYMSGLHSLIVSYAFCSVHVVGCRALDFGAIMITTKLCIKIEFNWQLANDVTNLQKWITLPRSTA